jgi:hypothetical protein
VFIPAPALRSEKYVLVIWIETLVIWIETEQNRYDTGRISEITLTEP